VTWTTESPVAEVAAALDAGADAYGLPRNFLRAIAWLESAWRETAFSCSYDIGVTQQKRSLWEALDRIDDPTCHTTYTTYSPYVMRKNVELGAKLLAWLSCYFAYHADGVGTLPHPDRGTAAWYYQHSGRQFPDTVNADGSPNPNSLCAAAYHDARHPEYAALTATPSIWSCPFNATAGDHSLFEIVAAAYNAGAGEVSRNGITNPYYVSVVQQDVLKCAAGQAPR
jgi:hypothetical protein